VQCRNGVNFEEDKSEEAEVDNKGEGKGEGVCVEDGENAPGANLATVVAFAHFGCFLNVLSKMQSLLINVLCW
jgi:hypothetical protein